MPAASPVRRALLLFDRADRAITSGLARASIPALRFALAVVFIWFGVLKFFPGLSPAETLAARTIETLTLGVVGPAIAIPLLATWETAIGIGLLTGRFMRLTLLLLAVQMAGTFLPLILFPSETFTSFPYAPTLEGQYIVKNLVLLGAGMVIGATVRGGGVVPEPTRPAPP